MLDFSEFRTFCRSFFAKSLRPAARALVKTHKIIRNREIVAKTVDFRRYF